MKIKMPSKRELTLLLYQNGVPLPKIADALGLSIHAVRRIIREQEAGK